MLPLSYDKYHSNIILTPEQFSHLFYLQKISIPFNANNVVSLPSTLKFILSEGVLDQVDINWIRARVTQQVAEMDHGHISNIIFVTYERFQCGFTDGVM